MQDAFASGIRFAYIPVFGAEDEAEWDTLGSLEAFARTNYTISAEIGLRSTDGPLQSLVDYIQSAAANQSLSTMGNL